MWVQLAQNFGLSGSILSPGEENKATGPTSNGEARQNNVAFLEAV